MVHIAVAIFVTERIVEIVAVGIEANIFVAHGIVHISTVHIAVEHLFGFAVFGFVLVFIFFFHHNRAIDFVESPSGEKLGEAFIKRGAVGFVVAYHSIKPVVSNFMYQESAIPRVTATIEGEHRVFHTIVSIGGHHFRVNIHPEIGGERFNDLCGVLGGILPFGGMRFQGQAHALNAIPISFTNAVMRIGGEGKIVHVVGYKMPCFALWTIVRNNHRWFFVPWFIGEVFDIEFFAQIGGEHVLLILQSPGGFYNIVRGEGEFHIEESVIAVQFFVEVLVGVPSFFSIVHRNARVPMHTIEVGEAPWIIHRHTTAKIALVEIGIEVHGKLHRFAGFQRFR